MKTKITEHTLPKIFDELKINEELRKHIWPLRPEEFELLESNILKDGIMDSIKVWDEEPKDFKCYSYDETKCDIKFGDDVWECEYCGYGVAPIEHTIIDGHNRYEIAKKHNLSYDIEYLDFDSIEEAMNWMDANQSGRRNLTKDQLEISIGRQYNREKKSMSEAGSMKGKASADFAQASTADKIATENNVSPRTVKNYGKKAEEYERLEKEAPDLYEGINNREITFKDIKKEQKKQKRIEEIEEVKKKIENEPIEIGNEKYDVIAIDPPWAYDEKGGFSSNDYDSESNRGSVDYPTMTVENIKKIELPDKDDTVLFLWTTHAFLKDAFSILEGWGYTYKATMVWDKEKMGIGRTIRMQCEFCILAVRGKPIIQGSSVRDIIREPRRQHSRKPDAFYELVNTMCIGRKLDYFSRENREGWDVFGAETEKF